MNLPGIALVGAATLATVAAAVSLHYHGLSWMAARAPAWRRGRSTVLVVVFFLMALHVFEIGVFGAAWFALLQTPVSGSVSQIVDIDAGDALFLSSLAYTSLGFDNLVPIGPIRILGALEALSGFVLVTWSASFTYLEMTRYWRDRAG